MIDTPSGASAKSMVDRSIRCIPESCHSNVHCPPPGHGGPPGGVASSVHSPTRTSSARSACSDVTCTTSRPPDKGEYQHAVGADSPGIREAKLHSIDPVGEQALATAADRREHHQAHLVDEVVCEQRLDEGATASDQDDAVGVAHQLGERLGQ